MHKETSSASYRELLAAPDCSTIRLTREASESSMEVPAARGLNKELDARSDATDTTMNFVEDVINGQAHVEVLQLAGIPRDEEAEEEEEEVPILDLAMKAWQKPLIYVGEDYVGTYHIQKNMTLTVSSDEEEKDDPWLPCCFAGYLTMPPYYQRGSKGFGSNVTGIFDCTCSKAASQAEFSAYLGAPVPDIQDIARCSWQGGFSSQHPGPLSCPLPAAYGLHRI